MYDSYFLRFGYLYVSGYYCVEGREVICNLYICDNLCNVFLNYFFYFLGFGCNVLIFMYFNNIVDS